MDRKSIGHAGHRCLLGVQVRASSPACRTTDPRGLVDGRFLRANWAGPRLEGGVPCTWWLLDLGPAHALACNYYTLRHDASANFLRSWAFQVGRPSLRVAAVSEERVLMQRVYTWL